MADEKASKQDPAKAKAAAEATGGTKCRAGKCKQPARAKGYCRKHYMAWRRGKIGSKHRYKTCSHEACRKPAVTAGRCAEHRKGAPAVAVQTPAAP